MGWKILSEQTIDEYGKKCKKLLCVCECGKEQLIRKNSKSKQCRECSNKSRLNNIIGNKYNKWEVLEYVGNKKYKCRCTCGLIKNIFRSTLINGDSKGCRKCNSRKTYCGDISMNRFYHIKRGARIRNIVFDISVEYIWRLFLKQNKQCALTGLPIMFADTCREDKYMVTASLDRIDNEKGYVEGNVQWLHKDINIMKQKFTQEKFIQYCNMISQKHPRKL